MKQLSVRIEDETYTKFRWICRNCYFRSANSQLSRMIREFVRLHEEEVMEADTTES